MSVNAYLFIMKLVPRYTKKKKKKEKKKKKKHKENTDHRKHTKRNTKKNTHHEKHIIWCIYKRYTSTIPQLLTLN